MRMVGSTGLTKTSSKYDIILDDPSLIVSEENSIGEGMQYVIQSVENNS